jgi:hypothetical protein
LLRAQRRYRRAAKRRNGDTLDSSQKLLPRRRLAQGSCRDRLKIRGSAGTIGSMRRKRYDTSCERASRPVLFAKNMVALSQSGSAESLQSEGLSVSSGGEVAVSWVVSAITAGFAALMYSLHATV